MPAYYEEGFGELSEEGVGGFGLVVNLILSFLGGAGLDIGVAAAACFGAASGRRWRGGLTPFVDDDVGDEEMTGGAGIAAIGAEGGAGEFFGAGERPGVDVFLGTVIFLAGAVPELSLFIFL